ncbi:unnamed protein product, partial [Symbiodinium microadriaticum]
APEAVKEVSAGAGSSAFVPKRRRVSTTPVREPIEVVVDVCAVAGAGHLVNAAFDPDEAVYLIQFRDPSPKPNVFFKMLDALAEFLRSDMLPDFGPDLDTLVQLTNRTDQDLSGVLGSWPVGQVSTAAEASSAMSITAAAPPHSNGHITVQAFPGTGDAQHRCRLVVSGNTFPLRDVLVSWERTQSGDRVIEISSSDAPALDELALLAKVFHVLRMEPGTESFETALQLRLKPLVPRRDAGTHATGTGARGVAPHRVCCNQAFTGGADFTAKVTADASLKRQRAAQQDALTNMNTDLVASLVQLRGAGGSAKAQRRDARLGRGPGDGRLKRRGCSCTMQMRRIRLDNVGPVYARV